MDELLQEFLTETGENLDTVDRELVRFEQDPNDRDVLRNIFRLVHTVKGTCGFIGLPRLEALTHAAESVIGQFRDGATVKPSAVTAILETIDRIKDILSELADKGQEPEGNDERLIGELLALTQHARNELAHTQPAEVPLDPVAAYLARHGQVAVTAEPASDDIVFRSAPEPQRGRNGRIEGSEPAASSEGKGENVRNGGPATLRVNVDTIEHLMTMVSELVLTRNQLLEVSRRQEDAGLKAPLQRLSLITAELQDSVMKTRMQPIGNAWSKLPRIVRDLSAELGKRIELATEGADTELDRQILDLIKDPLIHMVRNCADHAIELPNERREAGKPEQGTIRLSAYHEGGSVTIAIADDGRGLDVGRIRRKAVAQGLVGEAEAERLSDAQISRFIFLPGFSTTDAVTAVSGRGVGMDVVKANVDSIGGTIDITSRPGLGTTITVKIPLTLAIISALIVVAGNERYAIPQIAVRELVRVKAGDDNRIEEINGAPVLRLRGRLLPIVSLSELMGAPKRHGGEGFIVITQIGERQFGILVDGVFHTEEIVVKPMSSKLRHIALFSGNTILGDGAVVLIVDPNGVAGLIGASLSGETAPEPQAASPLAPGTEKATMLVFRTGTESLQALPLSLVARLEEVEAGQFQRGGGRTLLHYRGRLIPITPIADTQLRSQGIQPLVIVSDGDLTAALAVEAIVDIVEDSFELDMATTDEPGVIGSAMIRGRATDLIDLAHYLPLNGPGWLTAKRGSAAAARVLLVEPSDFLRDMLSPIMKASGQHVTMATDFDIALATAGDGFAIALLDLDRDSDAAFAFAAALRSKADGKALRILGLTTCETPDLHMRAAQAGLDEVLAKFDRRALLNQLNAGNTDMRQAA
ncbi:Signal transduction histidine kinase CheA [Hyphomicrobiales bacterium]|nr:Signal transduction histidine kinase CheA [Hyphomicrobiales bacterium]CAH1699688.1 Signal transduction histidine kinase CheA [Hyphomicrobiales bacterium]CAI0343419.1 two-component system, chemotaxis family, sensor kinase CheA [Hyphomicrobiales bacterium]